MAKFAQYYNTCLCIKTWFRAIILLNAMPWSSPIRFDKNLDPYQLFDVLPICTKRMSTVTAEFRL